MATPADAAGPDAVGTACPLAAQRRLEIGLALLDGGEPDAALEAVAAALEIAPGYADALFCKGQALEALNRPADSIAAYRAYLAAAPDDVLGATARLVLLGALPVPDRLPAAYVRQLFDQYAPRFERSLCGRLGYDAPQRLRQLVQDLRTPGDPLPRVLDLGCGTGLGGAAFRDIAVWLEGIDLSPGMVGRARRRGCYDALSVGELSAALGPRQPSFDLVLAVDVLNYLGDLAPVLAGARQALRPGGRFAFTLERLDTLPAGAPGYQLGEGHRFAHHPDHIAALAAAAGFQVERLARDSFRRNKGEPVPGALYVLLRPRASDTAGRAVDHTPRWATQTATRLN